jgi:hypothetical protein
MRRVVVLVAAIALAAPATAAAHLRTGRTAVDFRASVLTTPRAVHARVYRADLALRLTLAGPHRVVALGYLGEPFLRLEPDGVFVNAASPTAAGTKLAEPERSGRPVWKLRSRGTSVTWHDARVRGGASSGRWRIPLVIDGHRAHLVGTVERVGAPAAWPWSVIAAAFAAAVGIGLRRQKLLRPVTASLGAIAAAGTLLSAIGFALASTASQGTWIEGANEAAAAIAGAVVLTRGSLDAKALAGGFLDLLGLAAGLTKLPVFLHGIVLSTLPGGLERLAVTVAIAAGAAATVLGLVVFFDVLEHYEEPELKRAAERSSAGH